MDRDELSAAQFKNWIAWAKSLKIGLDFNPTFFAHPKVVGGFTLSSANKAIRQFWIEHGIRCREIGAAIGKALGKTCLTNLWIPDGMKDTPADRRGPRERLAESLDADLQEEDQPASTTWTPSSPSSSASARRATRPARTSSTWATPSAGKSCSRWTPAITTRPKASRTRFRPCSASCRRSRCTSAAACAGTATTWSRSPTTSRPSRRRSSGAATLDRVRIGLDYFDASINRVAAWVIGTRNMLKALLLALVAPIAKLRQLEAEGDYTSRLALMEDAKLLPAGAVWDYYCARQGVPVGRSLAAGNQELRAHGARETNLNSNH